MSVFNEVPNFTDEAKALGALYEGLSGTLAAGMVELDGVEGGSYYESLRDAASGLYHSYKGYFNPSSETAKSYMEAVTKLREGFLSYIRSMGYSAKEIVVYHPPSTELTTYSSGYGRYLPYFGLTALGFSLWVQYLRSARENKEERGKVETMERIEREQREMGAKGETIKKEEKAAIAKAIDESKAALHRRRSRTRHGSRSRESPSRRRAEEVRRARMRGGVDIPMEVDMESPMEPILGGAAVVISGGRGGYYKFLKAYARRTGMDWQDLTRGAGREQAREAWSHRK